MITLLVLAACLLVIGLLFGKRFGVPVLGLAGGLLISNYMSATLIAVSAPYIQQYVSYVPAGLVVLPALVLLVFVKGRHRILIPRIINSVVFAFAALVFIIASPSTPASLTGSFGVITNNVGLIVTAIIGVAVLEVAFGKASKKKLEEPKK